jgi:hypothetical protein
MCLLLIGCCFWLSCRQLCLRRACWWLVSPPLILAAAARLCPSVFVLLFLPGPLLAYPSLLLVKRARLPLLLKQACLLPARVGFL